jgi:hypothetical protein
VDDAIWDNLKPYITKTDILYLSDLIEDEIKESLRENIGE